MTLNNPDDYLGRIMNECYLINKGVRSAFTDCLILTEFDEEDKESNKQFIKDLATNVNLEDLIFYINEYPRREDDIPEYRYYDLWIFKYPHQLKIRDNLYKLDEYMREYVIGKLLGYSDQSMEEFLSKNYPND